MSLLGILIILGCFAVILVPFGFAIRILGNRTRKKEYALIEESLKGMNFKAQPPDPVKWTTITGVIDGYTAGIVKSWFGRRRINVLTVASKNVPAHVKFDKNDVRQILKGTGDSNSYLHSLNRETLETLHEFLKIAYAGFSDRKLTWRSYMGADFKGSLTRMVKLVRLLDGRDK